MTGRAGPSAGCPLRESVLPVSLTVTSRLVRPVGDLPIHCKIIQVHCNAIQTLLQLNSNNSDVLQLSGRLAGDVKESRNDSPTRGLQMAADRTRPHTLCGPVVSSLFSVAARC